MPCDGKLSRVGYRLNPLLRPTAIGLVLMLVGLTGCSTVDSFGGRTVHYGSETASSKSVSVLANVIRSANGEPLQFSDISTISGQGNVSATLGAVLPVSVTPASATSTYSLNPSTTLGGTSTFAVTNLNTAEFYNGIQTPISLAEIINLIDAGYDARLVLFLSVSDIYIEDGRHHIEAHNSASRDERFDSATFRAFWSLIGDLVADGFSAQAGAGEAFGPKLTAADIADPRVIATFMAASGTDLQLKTVKTPGATAVQYQFFKKGGLQICFDRLAATGDSEVGGTPAHINGKIDVAVANNDAIFLPFNLILGQYQDHNVWKSIPDLTVAIDQSHLCGYKKPDGSPDTTDAFKFSFKTRSLEGVFQFLGAVARAQTNPLKSDREFVLANDKDRPTATDPFVFRVLKTEPHDVFASVNIDGSRYYVRRDRDGYDRSTRVIQILTDLMALQSSAKNIPAPSLISVLGR